MTNQVFSGNNTRRSVNKKDIVVRSKGLAKAMKSRSPSITQQVKVKSQREHCESSFNKREERREREKRGEEKYLRCCWNLWSGQS